MPCMCGDTHCWSCGPAQGNWKCPICGSWADDGCEHIDEESGEIKSEHQAAADAALEKERADMAAYAADLAHEWETERED